MQIIFKKIKVKLNDFYEKFLISFIFLIKSPKIGAFLISLTVKNVNESGSYKILCLRRSIFMDDVAAMAKFSGKLHYLALSRNIIQGIFWRFLEAKNERDLHYQNYYSDTHYQDGITRYHDYLKKLVPELKKIIGFDAIFSGNFVYVEQQELAQVCKELQIPFVVLHKESLTVGVYKDAADLHKGCRFIGDKMMVYNDKVKEQLTELENVGGLSKDLFVVVGAPRIDYLFKETEAASTQKQVVFFSSIPTMRFSRLFDDKNFLSVLEKRAEDFHVWAMQFARKNPDIKVVIKTKVAQYYLDHPKKIFSKYFDGEISNLDITSKGNPADLIKKSIAVCAFNSMTQIEALVINKPVISAYYGDLIPDQPWDYFGEFPGLVQYAKSYDEFEKLVLNSSEIKPDSNLKESFLQRFIGFTDGNSSKRAEDEIIKVIESSKNNDEARQIWQMFKEKSGSETIAGQETLEEIIHYLKNHHVHNILELGAGIGTISYAALRNSHAHIDLYEPNEFCINELQKNLSEFNDRYTLIDNYRTLPPKKSYDLVIVDGGAGERNNGSEQRTVFLFLSWLNSVNCVYVQGYRYGQRVFIRKALRDKYVYKMVKNSDGVKFILTRSNNFFAKWSCWLYWTIMEKVSTKRRK